ncbi:unnamed protein product [Leptidea sinapis]|uniref:DUF4780 domain-containing protein n=1 Tax=Leptidea sinapis TaxID=189913 RepID=A0A5E4QN37_9NEOP|nr:unnamed protein product [Leptidea sinapis]
MLVERFGHFSSLSDSLDPELQLELEQLQLKHLELEQQQIQCKQRILRLNKAKKMEQHNLSNRHVQSADGKLVVKAVTDKSADRIDGTYSGGGDSKDASSRQGKTWADSSENSSTPSTCVLCSEDRSTHDYKDKSESTSKCNINDKNLVKTVDFSSQCTKSRSTGFSKSVTSRKSGTSRYTASEQSEVTSKRGIIKSPMKSEISSEMKGDYYIESDDEDETNRLIQLRNADYMDIVREQLKIVIALAGYPKSKMRLKQMEIFQRCIKDITDMQLKAGLLKKPPTFIDYYLSRGAIVCICKDDYSRDWMVRITPGLQERMSMNLILLKSKIKRLCVAVMKIPQSNWPANARDAFKLLQYFNPTLKTHLWQIYGHKIIDDIECTSFLIDRISAEIIRGPIFKNVIDYSLIEFDITGFTEIYYDCFQSDMDEDLHSVASRVKLLEEIRSSETSPRTQNGTNDRVTDVVCENVRADDCSDGNERIDSAIEMEGDERSETKEHDDALEEINNDNLVDNNVTAFANEAKINLNTDISNSDLRFSANINCNEPSFSTLGTSDITESLIGSSDNLILSRNSCNLNIDSNRGIAYHRRTNYLHIENELKIAITLENYPKDKLEGNHIRRMKHLFKEYLHKDMKLHRFTNMIIPKFQDVYLSNGAVIYICDSLETKDYLAEILPKFINCTGLKLTFREVQTLVRYTRLVMRLPKELAHLESVEILKQLKSRYPNLKPDCWKYYSDIAGKQKRQFGVDPDSLEVIKNPNFDSTYEGENLVFRIIDRQKRERGETVNDPEPSVENLEKKKLRDQVIKRLYCPLVSDRATSSLTRIRANHYSDLVPDDLKFYVGPVNYPETRIDENKFQAIKESFEDQVVERQVEEVEHLKMHDIYLFDGVIFIICKNISTKIWIEEAVTEVNKQLMLNLKVTEFRGAVGIVNLAINDDRDPDEVIAILQEQNPRLRSKYWRKINEVRTKSRLEVVLQIDKLSAQVISDNGFKGLIGDKEVVFNLGHLKSLINPKMLLGTDITETKSIKEKTSTISCHNFEAKINIKPSIEVSNSDDIVENETPQEVAESKCNDLKNDNSLHGKGKSDSSASASSVPKEEEHNHYKITLKVPIVILPDNKDGLVLILDLLEERNPGLNTELWKMQRSQYRKGLFNFIIDKNSAIIINSKKFNPVLFGERLTFLT